MLDDDENTNVFMRQITRRRLLTRLGVIGTIGLAAAAAAVFVSHSKDTGWSRFTQSEDASKVASDTWTLTEKSAPTDGTAAVEVHLLAPGQIWVDGGLIGPRRVQIVSLRPGLHKIMAQFGNRMLTQQLRTLEGEVYQVEFSDTATAKRLAPK